MLDIVSDRSTTVVLAAGGSIDSLIDVEGDVDLVRVDLVAGRSYTFDLLGAASGLALADPYLTLFDATLAVVAADDDSGLDLDARIAFTAATTGTFYVAAAAFAGAGSYRLTMRDGVTPDDHGADAAGAGTLAIGASAAGAIETYADRDWFRVTLTAGQGYRFSLDGADHGHGTLADPQLALYDAAGVLLDRDDDSGDGMLDAQLDFTPEAGGVYYLEAASFGDGLGSYRIAAASLTGGEQQQSEQAIATPPAPVVVPEPAAPVVAPPVVVPAPTPAPAPVTRMGTAGDDLFLATAGDDLLIGGGGSDTVRYAGLAQSYSRAVSAGHGTVSGGPEGGTDTLDGVRTIAFADGYLTSDPDSHAAQVSRLYGLVLERAPDSQGLNGWTHALENGASLGAVAEGFTASREFQAKTAGLTTADFVEFLYQNALGRASDAPGKADWTRSIDSGTLTRGEVVTGFSESNEYRSLTGHRFADGLFIYDETYAAISSLYDAFADRLPDEAGLRNWVAHANGGMSIDAIADGFAGSTEFQQKIAGLSERGIVEMLYRNVLDREGDAAGIDHWTRKLESDHDVGGLLWNFAGSPEHQILMQPVLADGVMAL